METSQKINWFLKLLLYWFYSLHASLAAKSILQGPSCRHVWFDSLPSGQTETLCCKTGHSHYSSYVWFLLASQYNMFARKKPKMCRDPVQANRAVNSWIPHTIQTTIICKQSLQDSVFGRTFPKGFRTDGSLQPFCFLTDKCWSQRIACYNNELFS